ncbi:MAG: glycosyltransferase family 2 protein [Promethearchaeati archaeon]
MKRKKEKQIAISEQKKSSNTQNPNSTFLSIVIPLYNEENSIANVIRNIPYRKSQEIIVVNDGSTDKSVMNAKKLNDKNVRIIHHPQNLGYGAALLTGIKLAKGDIIVTLDSDGQHDPKEIPNIINPIIKGETDIVVGSRYMGTCHYTVPLHTRMGEYVIDKVLWVLFGQPIKNNQSGYRAFNKDVKEIVEKSRFKGMGFTTELLFKSGIRNFKFREVPIEVSERSYGTSYVYLPKLIISILILITYYSFLNIVDKIYRSIFKK